MHILNECNRSDNINAISLENDDGQPSTTITILFQDKLNRLFYLMCGDSGFQVKKNDGTLIDKSIGNSEPLFNLSDLVSSEVEDLDVRPCPNQIRPLEAIEDETNVIGYEFGSIQLGVGDKVFVASDGVWDNFKEVPTSASIFFKGERSCALKDSFHTFFKSVLKNGKIN